MANWGHPIKRDDKSLGRRCPQLQRRAKHFSRTRHGCASKNQSSSSYALRLGKAHCCAFYLIFPACVFQADYTLNCFDARYNTYVNYAYFGSIYPIVFPLFTIVILYFFFYRRYIRPGAPRPPPGQKHLAVVDGMKFVYENYRYGLRTMFVQ